MTLKELSQLYYLNREIEMDQQRLDELRSKAEFPSSVRFTGLPGNASLDSGVDRYVAEIIDLAAIISTKQQRCLRERNRLERYIRDIDDSLTRQIFTLRFINGLSWSQVAYHIGGGLTDAYVRNACYRHLRKTD